MGNYMDKFDKQLLWFALIMLASFLLGFYATAQEASVTITEVAQKNEMLTADTAPDISALLPVLIEAFQNGHWMVFGAALVMLLTFAVKKFVLPRGLVSKTALPLAALGLSLLASASAEVVAGRGIEAAIYILVGGLVSPALYDALKPLHKKS